MVNGIRVWIEPTRNFTHLTNFHAFDRAGKRLGVAQLDRDPLHPQSVELSSVNTESYKGKGTGASEELIKARIVHAFRSSPLTREARVILPSDVSRTRLAKAFERYGQFGFKPSNGRLTNLVLTREDYEALSSSDVYVHRLLRKQPLRSSATQSSV